MFFYLLTVVQTLLVLGCSGQSISKTGCGSTKGCFFKPDNCDPDKNCAMGVTYQPTDRQSISFELTALLDPSTQSQGQYVAVGFSLDQEMGKDAVTYCVHKFQQNDHVGLSFNPGKSNEPLKKQTDQESDMLANQRFWNEGREGKTLFVCRFEQRLNSTSNSPRVYDLGKAPYYLLLATGPADAQTNVISKHTSLPVVSSTSLLLTSLPAAPQNPTEPQPSGGAAPQGVPEAAPRDNNTKDRNATEPANSEGTTPPPATAPTGADHSSGIKSVASVILVLFLVIFTLTQ